LLSVGSLRLPYHFEHYQKESISKIDRVCQIANSLPTAIGPAYALCDSWFTCTKVIEAHFKKGYHFIGGLKTNRIIYPQGIRISLKDFATYIKKDDVRLVTVNRQSYWVYRYKGALNELDNAVVLFTWHKDAFLNPKAMRCFLSTDMELDTQTTLEYYSKRWPIEIFFSQTKGNLGINQYQVRHLKVIKRFWSLTVLTYLFCVLGKAKVSSFSQGLSNARKEVKGNLFTWIYKQSQANIPLSKILERLKVA